MALGWNRENKPGRNLPKASVGQQPFSFIFSQKSGVFVEFTIADHVPRHRIERVVLKDSENASWPKDAADITREADAIRDRHVMEYADRRCRIEALGRIRQV